MAALDREGLAGRTLVHFTSDNGAWLEARAGREQLGGSNGIFRGERALPVPPLHFLSRPCTSCPAPCTSCPYQTHFLSVPCHFLSLGAHFLCSRSHFLSPQLLILPPPPDPAATPDPAP